MRNYLPQGTKYTKLQLNNVLNDVPGKSYPANAGIPGWEKSYFYLLVEIIYFSTITFA